MMNSNTKSESGHTTLLKGDPVELKPVKVEATTGSLRVTFSYIKQLLSEKSIARPSRLRPIDLSDEDLEDIAAAEEALRDPTRIPWSQLKEELGL